jgi:hypothetical protein
MRVMHIRRGLPLISALHDPQRPALQFQRTASVGSCFAWMSWMASSTTMPGVRLDLVRLELAALLVAAEDAAASPSGSLTSFSSRMA